MPSLCLAQHASYRCRHSGACCTSNWPIHVEEERLGPIREALADGRVALPLRPPSPFVVAGDLPPGAGAVLRTTSSGACAFYDRGVQRCAVHRGLGHAALPSACQHFPRRCLVEPGTVFVSLSHYCPTVARMAFAPGDERGIVTAPGSLVSHVRLEGLDARGTLPPLLRPGMLADLDGYHAWERAVVRFLEDGEAPETSLARVGVMTARIVPWSPGQDPLTSAVARGAAASRIMPTRVNGRRADEATHLAAFEIARAAVPEALRPAAVPSGLSARDGRFVAPSWPGFSRPLGRFLAAHAFGNWCAYLGTGLMTVVRSLDLALAVVRVEAARLCAERGEGLDEPILADAFRAADLLLVHLADPKALAASLDGAAGRARRAGPVYLP
jgi:Fe-S-cluster containining protein